MRILITTGRALSIHSAKIRGNIDTPGKLDVCSCIHSTKTGQREARFGCGRLDLHAKSQWKECVGCYVAFILGIRWVSGFTE